MVHICLITYKKLDQLVHEAIATFTDEEIRISVIEGLRNEIIEKKNRNLIEKADVVIAGGANARIARENFDLPVLEYKITDFDYIASVRQGLRLGKRVAIVTYRTPVSDKLMGYFREEAEERLVNLIYEDTEELCNRIQESDVDVVIGAAHAVEMGEELGKRTVLIYPGMDSIKESILTAKELALQLQREGKRNRFMKTMMDYSSNGILLVDMDGIVVDCNRTAAKMSQAAENQIKGAAVTAVLPWVSMEEFSASGEMESGKIVQMEGQEIYQRIARIEDRKMNFDGAVIILTKLSDLKEQIFRQEKSRKYREEKGFAARKGFSDMIGSSAALKNCIEDAKFFAKSDASILIYGETGVGKEVFAQSIHNYSNRKKENFIAINCAAIPENLLESELFGYDEGAFTGGKKGGKRGLFELADKGTIFLDEIGEISPALQSRLLRVLQEKEIMHVGGDKIIPVDVRVISATNKDFEAMTDAQFRRDLIYRLSVLELTIPPLREREGDIVELFDAFYKGKRDIRLFQTELTDEVKKILNLYSWPGNIRELQNVCERFCIFLGKWTPVTPRNMKNSIIKAIGEKRLLQDVFRICGYDGKNISEELVLQLKQVFSYNREQIAQILGVSRTTIWRLMKEEKKASSD